MRPGVRAGGPGLLLVGVLMLAVNLRPAAVSVGPVLAEVRAGLGLGDAAAGLLTSLPVLGFALFGALAPALAVRLGLHRAVLLALVVVSTGLVLRSLIGVPWLFLLITLLALGGMATANVLMPSLVRRHFPDRVGPLTSAYTTLLALGLTAAFALTVPLADLGGSWRVGLGAWAVPAVLATLVWVVLARRPDRPPVEVTAATSRVRFTDVARTPLGWAMVLFFGMQSMLAYAIFGWFATLWRDAGFSPARAGLLVATVAAASVPMSFVLPRLMATGRHQAALLTGVCACYPIGFLGLELAPSGPRSVLWAALIGVGTATFPIVLVMIGLRARTAEGTAALSGFTQSLGYLFAALGPFGVGLLHSVGDGWGLPLLVMGLVVVPLLGAGLAVLRLPMLEDALGDRLSAALDPQPDGSLDEGRRGSRP